MGYSGRYHAASLAAVFVALAIGILIGAGLGSDVISGTADDLERSLKSDLENARGEVVDLNDQLDRERGFEQAIYPAVVGRRLANANVALVAFGDLPEAFAADVREALAPSGATVSQVAVIREPPSVHDLVAAIGPKRFAQQPARGLKPAAVAAGRALVQGGSRFEEIRDTLLSRFSGDARGTDAVVVARYRPDGLDRGDATASQALEDALLEGMGSTKARLVGAEASTADPSSIDFFAGTGMSTVDNVDLLPGRVALVAALAGADGNFGVKDSADRLLPDLLSAAPVGRGRKR